MHRALTFRGVGLFRRYGAGQTPSQELLELAEDDGWGWCYDPTNPNYRTLGTDPAEGDVEVVRQVRDGLETYEPIGKGTDGSPEDVGLSPYYHKAAIGSWDGMEFHDRDSLGRRLRLPALAAPISQPYFIMALVKSPSGGSETKRIFDKDDSLIVQKSGTSDLYGASVDLPTSGSTLDFNIGRGRDAQTILIGILVDGATSKTWVNGVEDASGDIFGTSDLDGFTLGASEDGQSAHWDGRIGPVVLREGEPSDAVRQRMENLLLKYSDAEIFDVPEALDLDGLALWLDGSHPETLRDFSGAVAADGSIYRWADKSGLLNHAIQATSGARPIRKVGEQNGLDVVRFDGLDDILQSKLTFDIHNASMFAVCRLRDSGGDGSVSRTHTPTTDTRWYVFTWRTFKGASGITFSDDTDTAWKLIGLLGTPTEHINRINGVESTAADTNQGTTQSTYIGGGNTGPADDDPASWGDVDIAAVVLYTRTLTTPEREQVEEYLQNEWATPALP